MFISMCMLIITLNADPSSAVPVFTTRAALDTDIDRCITDSVDGVCSPAIGTWNVSAIIDMNNLFRDRLEFNADISAWDVAQVTEMGCIFNGAYAFNQPIGSWNVE